MTTHYETLGVPPLADAAEIRSAYRKLALLHHPDRTRDPVSHVLFIAATDAYDVLSDPARRLDYDGMLARFAETHRPATPPRRPDPAPTRTPDAPRPRAAPDLVDLVARMKGAYSLGRIAESERLAREVIARAPRTAEAYAVLGDVARARGKPSDAMREYALAVQYDPRNEGYARRYEEIVTRTSVSVKGSRTTVVTEVRGHPAGPALGGVVAIGALAAGAYLQESPVLPVLSYVSTWTVPSIVSLIMAGMAVGIGLSVGGLVERFHASTGGVNPAAALGTVAIVNFWFAGLVYAMLGAFQGSFTAGVTRLLAASGAVTVLAMVAGLMNPALDPLQTLTWGGNLVYLGALCGWLVADSFRS